MKKFVLLCALAAALGGAGYWYWQNHQASGPDGVLRLYGNVDIRMVSLAFEVGGRIRSVSAEEGQTVKSGQVLAELDATTLMIQSEQAKARLEQASQNLLRLENGTRPEEIEQARSALASARAQTQRAKLEYDRVSKLWSDPKVRSVSTQQYENAKSAWEVARAAQQSADQAFRLAKIGPRAEDVAAARAAKAEAEASVRLIAHQIDLCRLTSPQDGIVRSRYLETGDMASTTKPVYSIALTTPKWVRVYVSEPDLGRVKPGMKALVYTDTAPDRAIEGRVGYISSVAEFTPKNVQTEELRTSLVYEVRIVVNDAAGALRLGQPATVVMAGEGGS
jgi:HlyD family secretion protein